jgi:hypothetical protein
MAGSSSDIRRRTPHLAGGVELYAEELKTFSSGWTKPKGATMNILSISASLALAVGGTAASGTAGGQRDRLPPRAATVAKTVHTRSTANRSDPALVSVKLAAFGSTITSPRGPFRARPGKIAFDLGGYYGAGTKGLWIDHLKWADWGQPVAFASGVVHARVWPGHTFVTTPGGIMIDQVRSCGNRTYYTYASMLVPAGYPENTESTSVGTSEQALTPCQG